MNAKVNANAKARTDRLFELLMQTFGRRVELPGPLEVTLLSPVASGTFELRALIFGPSATWFEVVAFGHPALIRLDAVTLVGDARVWNAIRLAGAAPAGGHGRHQ